MGGVSGCVKCRHVQGVYVGMWSICGGCGCVMCAGCLGMWSGCGVCDECVYEYVECVWGAGVCRVCV